jgi:hypothetical protein
MTRKAFITALLGAFLVAASPAIGAPDAQTLRDTVMALRIQLIPVAEIVVDEQGQKVVFAYNMEENRSEPAFYDHLWYLFGYGLRLSPKTLKVVVQCSVTGQIWREYALQADDIRAYLEGRSDEAALLANLMTVEFGPDATLEEASALADGPDSADENDETTLAPGLKPVGPVRMFEIGNIEAVNSGPRRATLLKIERPIYVVSIQTYHWNSGRGSKPGTIRLVDDTGREYGPWRARGLPGQGGVRNAYWLVKPGIVLEKGTYTIVPSNRATWSTNRQAKDRGFVTLTWRAMR